MLIHYSHLVETTYPFSDFENVSHLLPNRHRLLSSQFPLETTRLATVPSPRGLTHRPPQYPQSLLFTKMCILCPGIMSSYVCATKLLHIQRHSARSSLINSEMIVPKQRIFLQFRVRVYLNLNET